MASWYGPLSIKRSVPTVCTINCHTLGAGVGALVEEGGAIVEFSMVGALVEYSVEVCPVVNHSNNRTEVHDHEKYPGSLTYSTTTYVRTYVHEA